MSLWYGLAVAAGAAPGLAYVVLCVREWVKR